MLLRLVALILLAASLFGCVLFETRRQQERLDRIARIEGSVSVDGNPEHPIVVVLAQQVGELLEEPDSWRVADYYVREQPGPFLFGVREGRYRVGAFEDRNENLVYDAGEPVHRILGGPVIEVAWGETSHDNDLRIRRGSGSEGPTSLDVAAAADHTAAEQQAVTLRALITRGQVAALDDPRFGADKGKLGLWRPADHLVEVRPGVYFLQEFRAGRVPVLFVHGIGGYPQEFTALVEHLDRDRFQPWVFVYPSGGRLQMIAGALVQILLDLRLRHGFDEMAVVAHSMGGLISRSFLLQLDETGDRSLVPLFISISTPWSGHAAAESGARHAESLPSVISFPDSFLDMAPSSDFLRDLFSEARSDDGEPAPVRTLPRGTAHHLIFGYRRPSLGRGGSSDGTIALSSQLREEAQRQATSRKGVDADHAGILRDPVTLEHVSQLLAAAFD